MPKKSSTSRRRYLRRSKDAKHFSKFRAASGWTPTTDSLGTTYKKGKDDENQFHLATDSKITLIACNNLPSFLEALEVIRDENIQARSNGVLVHIPGFAGQVSKSEFELLLNLTSLMRKFPKDFFRNLLDL